MTAIAVVGCADTASTPTAAQQSPADSSLAADRPATVKPAEVVPNPTSPLETEQHTASTVTIHLVNETSAGTQQRIEVRGLGVEDIQALEELPANAETWAKILRVKVLGESADVPTSMLGAYHVKEDRLVFVPRYPLRPGLRYQAELITDTLTNSTLPPNNKTITHEFTIEPLAELPPAVVKHVYPSRSILPENNLKFYLHFSAPMSRGEAYRHVHLYDSTGAEMQHPFLELDEELWDADATRFTLFFDPGRIKRGLKPREIFGPPLEEGKSYRFVVDAGWRDATGRPLTESYSKEFKVVAPDDTQPDATAWKIQAPLAGSTEVLTVRFDEPLDQALLSRVVSVENAEGETIPGEIIIAKEETVWQLKPRAPWQAGKYAIVVDALVEDLAGNSLAKPFEVDVFRKIEREITTELVRLPFEVDGSSPLADP